jgi:hypothetical protein
MGGKFQRTRSSTTHGAVPIAGLVETVQLRAPKITLPDGVL